MSTPTASRRCAAWTSSPSLKLGDASRVAPVDKPSVVLVAFFGVFFLGERLSAINRPGVAGIAGGVILLTIRA